MRFHMGEDALDDGFADDDAGMLGDGEGEGLEL
jgi:hypothetical protein